MTPRRFVLGLLAAAVAVPVVLLGAAAALVVLVATTTAGARWGLTVADELLPGEIAVGDLSGSLVAGLVLEDLRYESPSLRVTAERLVLVPAAAEWLEGRAVLEELALTGTDVALLEPAGQREAADEPPALPAIPEWLEVRSLRVDNLAFADFDFVLTALEASVEGPRIDVGRIDARYGTARVEAEADLRVDGNVMGHLAGSFSQPAADAPEGAADATRVELDADVSVVSTGEQLEAQLTWQPLVVQAAGRELRSEQGRLTATLDGDVLLVDELAADALGGSIAISGAANLASRAGHASIDYEGLDPSLIVAELEGRLSGSLVAAFAVEPELVVGAAADAEGVLGGEPLDAALLARQRGDVTYVDRARMTLAGGSVEAGGTIAARQVDFTFDAEIPEVRNWYPPVSGSVTASGSVEGPADDPAVEASVRGDGLVVEGVPPVDAVTVTVSGTGARHTVVASADSAAGALTARVEQGWNGERLAGTLLESRLTVERAGAWSLTAPADYTVSAAEQSIEQACFAGPAAARLCASFVDDTLEVEANDVPAALAAAAAGSGLDITGAADLTLTLALAPQLAGSLTLTQPVLGMRAPDSGEAPPTAADLATLENLSVTGTVTTEAVVLELSAVLAATGDPIAGRLRVTPPSAEGALDAALTARLSSLAPVGALVEDIDELQGTAEIDLRASGTPSAPVLDGQVVIDSLSASVPELGISLTNGRLTARAESATELAFDASICSVGCVELAGNLDLEVATSPWQLDAALRGDGFLLADLADLRAVIAPDLTVDATPERWLVEGELTIAEGLLAVEDIPPGAVRPVPETVVHGVETEAEDELPIPLVLDVTVSLGDVRFAGLGVSAELDGAVNVERSLEGQLLVIGTTSIEEGTFSAYGQELTIERGDLLFTGTPENPALDLRATREVEGATVGLSIMGTLRTPESEVFSMPTLDETEALARLITGRSLQNAAPADGAAIERAALGLGIRRALPALDRLGDRLGLDELGVASAGDESGALVAGRQLGEDVYLRYKHGLFDDFAGLELIYRLTERFRLRTETGTSQSLDLIYERNPRKETSLAETESPFEGVPSATPEPAASAAPEPAAAAP